MFLSNQVRSLDHVTLGFKLKHKSYFTYTLRVIFASNFFASNTSTWYCLIHTSDDIIFILSNNQLSS